MAIGNFNGASYLVNVSTAASVDCGCPPVTIGTWFYMAGPDNPPNNWTLTSIGRNNTSRFASIGFRYNTGPVWYAGHTNGTGGRLVPQTASTGAGFTLDKWFYVAMSLNNTGITACWINSALIYSSVNDTFVTNTNVSEMDTGALPWDRLSVGVLRTSTVGTPAPTGAYVAETAFWCDSLSQDEIRSLAKGIKPSQIRPDKLFSYLPEIRNFNGDIVRGVNFNIVGALEAADHARRYG